jgi:hypothetical protein
MGAASRGRHRRRLTGVKRSGLSVARVALARLLIKVLTMKLPPWQARMTLWIAVVGPPVASLILVTVNYFPILAARTKPADVSALLVLWIFFAVPAGYGFGGVPALLAGALYSAVLTAMATRRLGMLPRACLAAICGGAVCGVWFHVVAGPNWRSYGGTAAFVATLLSLRWPQVRTSDLALRQPERLREVLERRVSVPAEAARHDGSRGMAVRRTLDSARAEKRGTNFP